MTDIPENPNDELEGQHPPLAQPAARAAAAPELGAQPGAGLAEHGLRARAGESGLAAGTTRPPDDATRSFDTAQGRLTYAELAERLAAPLQAIDLRIRRGDFAASSLDEPLLLGFHAALSQELLPDDAGRYRRKAVQVGAHLPPEAHQVPQRMRDYVADIDERMRHLTGEADDLLLEFLAFAEGQLLSIHPFPDLNGRVSRLWLSELLRRLDLPPVDVVPAGEAFRTRYLAALSAADQRNWAPLIALWQERLGRPAHLNETPLAGCTPTPLASYLKALAVLRLVAEAGDEGGGDAAVTGFWRDDVFVLRTRLTTEQLTEFFSERYQPTPLIAPWNGGSGFYANDNKDGIEALAKSTSPRFQNYRAAIDVARSAVERLGLTESPKLEEKSGFLRLLRNAAPDALLRWMDAAVIFSEDGPRYPPLLGTGGNDGRLDFTNNFMQRLADVIDIPSGRPLSHASQSLRSALFGSPSDAAMRSPIGQFAPGSAGGPNSSVGFEGEPSINGWDFLLMLEGAVLFGASMARRLETADPAVLIAPFTVRSRAGTVGSAAAGDDANARGETWMPLWSAPAGLHELQSLLSEGRVAVNGRAGRDGLDFARAVAQLGVDRGISQFQRFGFLMRSGKAFLATPMNRIPVHRNPDADLIADLDRHHWLASVQRHARDDNAPHVFRSAARQLDTALFALTQRPGRDAVQTVLHHVGRIEAALDHSPRSREAVRSPAPLLSTAWALKADDGSPDFRIACALAALGVRSATGPTVLNLRRHLIAVGEPINRQGDRQWEPSSRVATWRAGSLTGNLAALLHRRRLEAVAAGAEEQLLTSTVGATLPDISAFLEGWTNDRRIAELAAGLACVDLHRFREPRGDSTAALPPAFCILKVLFTPEAVLKSLGWLPEDRTLHLPADIPSRLASNDVQSAVRLAWQRMRAIGIGLPGRDPPQVVGADGPRWLAALCIPLTRTETSRLLRASRLTSDSDSDSDSQPPVRSAAAA